MDMSFPPLLLSLLKHLLLDGTPPTSSVQSAALLSSFASCYFLFPVMPLWLCLYVYMCMSVYACSQAWLLYTPKGFKLFSLACCDLWSTAPSQLCLDVGKSPFSNSLSVNIC